MDKENVKYTHISTHKGILFRHKKTEILSFGTARMDVGSIMLSEIRQRKANVALSPLYMESEEEKQNKTKNQPTKLTKSELTDSENRLVVARGVNGAWGQGKGWEWLKCMKRIKMYKLLATK